MSHAPFEQAESLRIGAVDFVSPDEIKVSLDIEAPESVALNTGGPRPFPRVNSYLLIPVDDGFIVGQIEWITVEHSPFPKRRGMQDFGLVDLPYPLRRLRLNPLGTLRARVSNEAYSFRRGTDALPSVGTAVLLPTDLQLRSIVECGEKRRVKIGTSPLAGDAQVCVDPNRLFGRHLAVLGNTGSGKSCSVAGLIRWSLEEAQNLRSGRPNARFIVLDPNGEYSRAFSAKDPAVKARIFKVDPDEGELPLKVPLWFWNSAEWCSFTQASAKTQRPLLRRALREVKGGRSAFNVSSDEDRKLHLRRHLSSILILLRRDLRSYAVKTEATKFGFKVESIIADIEKWIPENPDIPLTAINISAKKVLAAKHKVGFDKLSRTEYIYFNPFEEGEVQTIITKVESALASLGGVLYPEGPDEDVPLPFSGTDLADHLEILAEQENVTQFADFLVARIRTFISDPRMKVIITDDDDDVTLANWLTEFIGSDNAENECVSIIDLSLVPTEVIHIVTAVIARMVFEALQRYRKLHSKTLPTVLVMEEAHTFIKRYKEDIENQDAAAVCCQVFERIAREGRKFGLGLILSSQRPSELSPTVLSQCNTFLLHRLSNDRDQELVHRLVPDNLKGLLHELPLLPSQSAILLGWATELPVLLKMNDLPKSQQPHSDDPDFWGAWVGKDDAGKELSYATDWEQLAQDWQASYVLPTNEK